MTDGEDIGLVARVAMHARRHPAAVAGVWAWETILAILVAWPARSLAAAAFGGSASGDAALWGPGGHWLADFLRHDAAGARALTSEAGVVLLAGIVAGLVPMAALLFAFAYATRDKRPVGFAWTLQQAVRCFPALAAQLGLVGVLQAVAMGVGIGAGALVKSSAHVPMGEPRAQQLQLLVIALFVAVAAVLGVGRDLCGAAVVRFRVTGLRGLALGFRMLRLAPLSLSWSWAWRALASLAPIIVGAWVADRLGGRGGMPLFVLLVIHQSVVGSRVALRASWLARALRAVDGILVRRAGT